MNQGKYVFSQIIECIYVYDFNKCVAKYQGDYKIRSLTCWEQFLAMSLGQLGKRESLRDIIGCLEVHQAKLYHLGFHATLSRSTLAYANEHRDYRIFEEFAYILIRKARILYLDDPEFLFELDGVAYALDSTIIALCFSVFPWAKFRKKKAGIKLHTLIDLKGNIPSFIHITSANVHDSKILEIISFESGAYYVMDRGYLDFKKLYLIHTVGSYFITRAKDNTKLRRLYSKKIIAEAKQQGIRYDQVVVLTGFKFRKDYPEKLRRIKYYDREHRKYYVFLTNNFTLDAKVIADLYKHRWQIELFFKWIKQNLKIQSFWGYSENAVRVQIWIAIAVYALVAIIKKTFRIQKSMNEILQIFSFSLLDKTPINQLFSKNKHKFIYANLPKQLKLLDP